MSDSLFTVLDDFGAENHPPGWNRRDWVLREMPEPPAGSEDTEGMTEPLAGWRS